MKENNSINGNNQQVEKGAILSACSQYRYQLWRKWDPAKPNVVFIMLNPSTADADNDDPTIRRCIGFAKDWRYGSLTVVNLFAFRATRPEDLLKAEDPIGQENLEWIARATEKASTIVCAWGNGKLINRLLRTRSTYQPLRHINSPLCYLELSQDGTPKHPLYLIRTLKPKPYEIKILF